MRALALLTLLPVLAVAQLANPAISQDNIDTTICVAGWTATVRPPTSYTNKVKVRLMQELGLDPASARDYELDHVMPLAVGGHPADLRNLRLQAWQGPRGAHVKDAVESRVHRLVCSGAMSLEEGRACFTSDWQNCKKGQ